MIQIRSVIRLNLLNLQQAFPGAHNLLSAAYNPSLEPSSEIVDCGKAGRGPTLRYKVQLQPACIFNVSLSTG